MVIAELLGSALADRNLYERLVRQLRSIAQQDLRGADSRKTELASKVKAFIEWLDDRKPEFAGVPEQADKFARLIDLSRGYEECTKYYLRNVGVNSSTIWRWANEKSRPTKYIGERVIAEVRTLLVQLLWHECDEMGLTTHDERA